MIQHLRLGFEGGPPPSSRDRRRLHEHGGLVGWRRGGPVGDRFSLRNERPWLAYSDRSRSYLVAGPCC